MQGTEYHYRDLYHDFGGTAVQRYTQLLAMAESGSIKGPVRLGQARVATDPNRAVLAMVRDLTGTVMFSQALTESIHDDLCTIAAAAGVGIQRHTREDQPEPEDEYTDPVYALAQRAGFPYVSYRDRDGNACAIPAGKQAWRNAVAWLSRQPISKSNVLNALSKPEGEDEMPLPQKRNVSYELIDTGWYEAVITDWEDRESEYGPSMLVKFNVAVNGDWKELTQIISTAKLTEKTRLGQMLSAIYGDWESVPDNPDMADLLNVPLSIEVTTTPEKDGKTFNKINQFRPSKRSKKPAPKPAATAEDDPFAD